MPPPHRHHQTPGTPVNESRAASLLDGSPLPTFRTPSPTLRTPSALDDLQELTDTYGRLTPPPVTPVIKMEGRDEHKGAAVPLDGSAWAEPPTVRLPQFFSPSSGTKATSKSSNKMIHHEVTDLKAIGEMCRNRLPPASAVEAMFLYEMQRQTELEQLFHGQMFELSREKEFTSTQQSKLWELDGQMKALQKQIRTKEVDERLATSKFRLDAQMAKINEQSVRINSQDKRLHSVQQQVESISSANDENRRLVDSHKHSMQHYSHLVEDLERKVQQLQSSNLTRDAKFEKAAGKLLQLEKSDSNAMSMLEFQNGSIQASFQNTEAVKINLAASDARNLQNLLVTHSTLTHNFNKLQSSQDMIDGDLKALEDEFRDLRIAATKLSTDIAGIQTFASALKATQDTLNDDISVLFDERDMLINHLNAACTRIDKLEGTVRALTSQAVSPAAAPADANARNSSQVLPVTDAKTGKTFDLAVPKGKPLIDYRKASNGKENLRPIRPFVPGKQWEDGAAKGSGEQAATENREPGLGQGQWAQGEGNAGSNVDMTRLLEAMTEMVKQGHWVLE